MLKNARSARAPVDTPETCLMLRKLLKAGAVYAILALGALSGPACLALPGVGYWHTSGSTILDSNNQVVRIAGINWYGFETTDEVPHGLTSQDYKTVLQTILANGYNTVRLPFSNQMVETPIIPTSISYSSTGGPINTDLQGLNSLQIMDAIIEYAGQIGLRVILDDHRSEAGNSAEASGLWYTEAYPESSWIADWQALVNRYQNDTAVIGVDLRNEPHNAASGGSCWDCSTLTNDWHLAAERAGNAVLTINPKLLIFVEGTDEYNGNYYFWGGNLQGVQNSPVKLNVAGQLVYSAHDYGPAESSQPWFNSSTDYNSLVSTWTSYWAYVSLNGIAPVWLGEFGTLNDDADIQSAVAGSEGHWFSSLLQFLGANSSLNWTYWALNGEDRYGLLDANYDATPASSLKQQLLTSTQFLLSGGIPFMLPSFTLAQNPSTVLAASSNSDLGGPGDTTEVTYTAVVNNRSTSDLAGPTISLALPSAAGLHYRGKHRLSRYLPDQWCELQLQLRQHSGVQQRGSDGDGNLSVCQPDLQRQWPGIGSGECNRVDSRLHIACRDRDHHRRPPEHAAEPDGKHPGQPVAWLLFDLWPAGNGELHPGTHAQHSDTHRVFQRTARWHANSHHNLGWQQSIPDSCGPAERGIACGGHPSRR